MGVPLFGLLIALVVVFGSRTGVATGTVNSCGIVFKVPPVVLSDVNFSIQVDLPPFFGNETVPNPVFYFTRQDESHQWITRRPDGSADLTFAISENLTPFGHSTLTVNFSSSVNNTSDLLCDPQHLTLLVIPAPLALLPPIFTAVVAILFRQVLLALILGVWLCAFFANGYNPLTAILRVLDTYFVNSVSDHGHAAIIVLVFFLGGLIGVVQKGGGGIGLARLLKRFTNSRRKACLVCFMMCVLIFFDDYSCVMITGYSLRSVMRSVGTSREKFAFIAQSMGPTLPSIVPISSWIGVQIGYVQEAFAFKACAERNATTDPFLMVVKSIPYRFFPLLMLACVVIVCVLGRDFGPMLSAELRSTPLLCLSESEQESENVELASLEPEALLSEPPLRAPLTTALMERNAQHTSLGPGVWQDYVRHNALLEYTRRCSCWFTRAEPADDHQSSRERVELLIELLRGPLAPKKGVPYRWFNAVIPFLAVIIVTLVGMVLNGRQAILDMPAENRVPMTVINIFRYTSSVDALIWASALASLIAMVMFFVQCILSLRDFMQAWIEGIKDIMEALIILILAWALGAAIQDIQTPNYIAQSLQNRLSAQYLPVIVTLLGFLIAFATGSAFGTMGILFPLVIPTVCEITCNQDTWLQVTAAVLGSSIYGNVMSPIASLTILTAVATNCPMVSHLKTTLLYTLLVGGISLVFGSLPVGAGWYPWWAAWIIMTTLLVLLFVIFSASDSSHTSRSLCNRVFPCLYTIPRVLWKKCLLSLSHRCHKRHGDQPTEFRPNVNTTDTEILDPENVSLLASKQEGLTHRYYSSTGEK